MDFSVLLSVYKNDTPDSFKAAMDSIFTQSLPPKEIILIRDGIVSDELQVLIDDYVTKNESIIKYIPLETNCGLGNALKVGVEAASNEIIARMDADDICLPERFEQQIRYLKEHPEIDIVGGQIEEFIDKPQNIVSKRIVPTNHKDILKFIKRRCPFNHMTVMFKKSSVVAAGNYIDLRYLEDYYLWCRMLINGCKFANLENTLVQARIGKDMYKRRGGYSYFKNYKKLEKFKFKKGITNFWQYITALIIRFTVHVLVPSGLRSIFFKTVRKSKETK